MTSSPGDGPCMIVLGLFLSMAFVSGLSVSVHVAQAQTDDKAQGLSSPLGARIDALIADLDAILADIELSLIETPDDRDLLGQRAALRDERARLKALQTRLNTVGPKILDAPQTLDAQTKPAPP